MKFEDKYFAQFRFSGEQIEKNLNNAIKDLEIAKTVNILDVKFNYAYVALIKAGIALLSFHRVRIKSVPGHQVKIIEKTAQVLGDGSIEALGNVMRQKRNLDFYAGGIEVTEKECRDYISFVDNVLKKVTEVIRID